MAYQSCNRNILCAAIAVLATGLVLPALLYAEDAGTASVPLIVQEILPPGAAGFTRTGAIATFGMPFPQGQVPVVTGRPALGIAGPSPRWQFRTLATWPDGSVRWALADVQADVPANGFNTSLTIVSGTGQSGQPAIASENNAFITVDTGPGGLVAQIAKTGFNLFYQVWVDGVEIVPAGQSLGIVGTDPSGVLIVPKPGSVTVAIEENGPARAVVRADGTLHTLTGIDLLDFTCRIIARAGSPDLQVDFTVRNANINRPQHVAISGLGLVVRVNTGGNATANVARHNGTETTPLPPGESIFLHQALSAAPTYYPVDIMLGQDGYEIVKNGLTLWPLGDKDKFPPNGYADLTGDNGGVTLAYKLMPYESPASLELYGTGDVVAGLFSAHHPAGKFWTFNWRTHESRTVMFGFHHQFTTPPGVIAKSLDMPISGRAADYLQYDRAGGPYRRVTLAEENAAFAAMGLDYTVVTHNESPVIMRYIYSSEPGGFNNHDSIERQIGSEWLRQGFGGQYLTALAFALYKAEWQIPRSDNFKDIDDPGASNPELPHTTGAAEDYEHRYCDGVALAYWLTGDERLRDALFDEGEVLNHFGVYVEDRWMYQSFRALASVGEFTGDPDGSMRAYMKSTLEYFSNKLVNINIPDDWGWEAAPDIGQRRYFTSDYQSGGYYNTRGFSVASLGPIAFFRVSRFLGLDDPDGAVARGRMRDLAYYAREVYPYNPVPALRWLVYDYNVNATEVLLFENSDFHPIMLGQGQAYLDTGDVSYIQKGVEQFQGFAAHDNGSYSDNNLYLIETRLDVQDFLRIYLDYLAQSTTPPPTGPTLQFYGTSTPSCFGPLTIGAGPSAQAGSGLVAITVSGAPPKTIGTLLLSTKAASKSIKGATVLVDVSPNAASLSILVKSSAAGYAEFAVDPATILPSGLAVYAQYVFKNTACGSPTTWSASNGLSIVQP